MWKWIIIIPVITFGLTPAAVWAATVEDVTVTATPDYGITSFAIDYISETQLDLSWITAPDVVNVMVRSKYGSDLDEIPDEDTEPSDGVLVYYGSASSFSDTSMDFDQNPGQLFYKVWGQKADGKWYTGSRSAWEESAIVTLIALFIFCGILSFLGVRSNFVLLRLMGGAVWITLLIYWIMYPPSAITQGDAAHIAVAIVLIGMTVAIPLLGLGREVSRQKDFRGGLDTETTGAFHFKIPDWLKGEGGGETYAQKREKTEEALRDYRERMHGALNPRSKKK